MAPDDSDDTGNGQDAPTYDPDQQPGVLGNYTPPAWNVPGAGDGQPSVFGDAFNPKLWAPADNSLNFFVDPPTMKTIDFQGAGAPEQPGASSQPSQSDASGFTDLTPWQPDAEATPDPSVGPIDTPPFQYPDRLQTDQALSDDPRVQAFLATLRGQEGQRYDAVVGGGSFDDYSQHPDIGVGNSHAAGAYQFQPGTWAPIQKALNLPDFSPDSQDLAAVDLLRQTGATDKLLSGDLDGAIFAASRQWSGMPNQAETMTDSKGRTRGVDVNGNATVTLDQTKASYQKNLGP
jgi:muramidase (phage lysozyme)